MVHVSQLEPTRGALVSPHQKPTIGMTLFWTSLARHNSDAISAVF